MIEVKRLKEILDNFNKATVGIVGDFCIDAYWTLDTGARELSVETWKPTSAVTSQHYSLGGCGERCG